MGNFYIMHVFLNSKMGLIKDWFRMAMVEDVVRGAIREAKSDNNPQTGPTSYKLYGETNIPHNQKNIMKFLKEAEKDLEAKDMKYKISEYEPAITLYGDGEKTVYKVNNKNGKMFIIMQVSLNWSNKVNGEFFLEEGIDNREKSFWKLLKGLHKEFGIKELPEYLRENGKEKFCSECGVKIKKTAKFCVECGEKQ